MPLLFYYPLIVWAGLVEAMQSAFTPGANACAMKPVPVRTRRPQR